MLSLPEKLLAVAVVALLNVLTITIAIAGAGAVGVVFGLSFAVSSALVTGKLAML